MRGGSLFPLNPAEIGTSGIDFVDPSPTLSRSKPFIPPRPGAPSPPPPLGLTSGPAFGLAINAPPLLAGGSKKRRRKSKKRRKKIVKKYKMSYTIKKACGCRKKSRRKSTHRMKR